MARIREALFPDDVDLVRRLFEEYAADLGLDLCFQGFADELKSLPGRYCGPRGGIWLASIDGATAGCVALRPLSEEHAEMKRLYVCPACRGAGVGRALAEHAVIEATQKGYRRVCLDTLSTMAGAIAPVSVAGVRRDGALLSQPRAGALFFALELT